MNRKHFLQKAMIGASATLFPSWLLSCDDTTINPDNTSKTVIVIGAGIAGLAAARRLQAAGFSVIVLEARDRIGGRIFTDRSLGLPMDMGASWIHGPSNSNPITSLAKEAKAKIFMTNDDSVVVFDQDGNTISETKLDKYEADYQQLIKNINKNAASEKSLFEVIKSINPDYLTDPIMSYMLSAYLEFDLGAALEDISSKHWEDDEVFSGADVLFPAGYDALISHLSKGLDIRLNQVVNTIEYSSNKVKIACKNVDWEAEKVIVTLPLGVLKAKQVSFIPTLSIPKLDAIEKLGAGVTNKVVLIFEKPFWDTKIQYFGYCNPTRGMYPYFMNCDTFVTGTHALMAFAFGAYALKMEQQSDAQIQVDIMLILRKIFGQNIPEPKQILISRWSDDEFSRGAYTYAKQGSVPTDFSVWEQAESAKLYFAGEHTTLEYRGTVHGAYLSGERVAKSIIN